MPDFSYENQFDGRVIGIDEVGRGPLAGPVVAAAIYIDPKTTSSIILNEVNDSKKISANKRKTIVSHLRKEAIYGIGIASVEEIDRYNILQATFLSMLRAINQLPFSPQHMLIDGNTKPKEWDNATTIIKGDSQSISIAAASLIAKDFRDEMMIELDKQFPFYGWKTNVGYGTAEHLEGLKKHGPTYHHRRSFAPIKNMVQEKFVEKVLL